MTLDAWLAVAHHLAVFGLLGVVAVEWGIVRPGLSAADAQRVARVDAFYGLFALAVLVAGVARVLWGAQDESFYTGNPVFWVKMAGFATVGMLSAKPTARFLRWRATEAEAEPADDEVRTVRRFIGWQLAVFPVIPVAAALMARGIGR